MGDQGGKGVEVTSSVCRWWAQLRGWRWQAAGDQGGKGVEATSSGCWWWVQLRCPVVAKVVVVAGEAGRLLVHSFGQGSGVRWWVARGSP